MALQYRPPFEIDPYRASNALRGMQDLNKTVNNIGDDYVQNRYRQTLLDLQKKNAAREQQQFDIENVTPMAPYGPLTQSDYSMAYPAGQPSQPSPSYPPSGNSGSPYPSTPSYGSPSPSAPPSVSSGAPTGYPSQPQDSQNPSGKTGMPLVDQFYAHMASQKNPLANTSYGEQYMRAPGRKGREEMRLFQQDQSKQDLQQSEIEKNRAMAEMYKRGGPSSGSVQWKLNPYTGTYEAYPTKPGMGSTDITPANQPGTVPSPVPSGGAGRPAPSSSGRPKLPYQMQAKLDKEKPKAYSSMQNTLNAYDSMINEAKAIQSDPALGESTGILHYAGKIPGTPMKRVSARLETLKAKTLLNVLGSLKELSANGSSGFGALSNVEGENIRNSIASLDPSMSTSDFKQSLNRFISEMQKKKDLLPKTFEETYGDAPVGSTGGYSDGGGIEPDVLAYAQRHGISVEEAQQIKAQRTGGK